MFTGIITTQGKFKGYLQQRSIIMIESESIIAELLIGESLAVDGVCLSLADKKKNIGYFHLSQETKTKTTLGHLPTGWSLNLEPPLRLESFLSGHLVTGHVDGTGKIIHFAHRSPGQRIRVKYNPALRPFLIPKGSIALNGVSLTIAQLTPSYFECELIPLTLTTTNLGQLKVGHEVNLECDIIGKYMYNLLSKLGLLGLQNKINHD
ncbi:MAG: hypothetical protein B5M54_04425 [Candidatus Aminicenantes bacterium 4484_214]|nr:MAG: hypothetical protein B5M54_04425 [Candidatus Aminicenantes bacterium 4484_214]